MTLHKPSPLSVIQAVLDLVCATYHPTIEIKVGPLHVWILVMAQGIDIGIHHVIGKAASTV